MSGRSRSHLIFVLFLAVLASSCSDQTTEPKPTGPGKLVVYVYTTLGDSSPDKLVEVVAAGAEGLTDSTGIVEFTLEPGSYTVLIHEITGSITTYTAERAAVIRSDETTRLEIHDCILCLAP